MFDFLIPIFNTYKIISAIVSGVFLVLVIRLVIITDAFGGYRRYKLDVYKYGAEEKKRIPDVWKKSINLIRSKNPADWKQAALLAEGMFADMMKIESYTETDISEFAALNETRQRVLPLVREEGEVPIASVKELLREYREVFKKMGYL